MAPRAEGAASRIRVVAALLIVGLVAGPAAQHLYWVLGGTRGLHRSVDRHIEQSTSTGIRVVAAVVVMLLVAAVLVVLARVGLAADVRAGPCDSVLCLGIGGDLSARGAGELHLQQGVRVVDVRPVSFVLGLLALVVAGSGGAWRIHRPHRMLTSH